MAARPAKRARAASNSGIDQSALDSTKTAKLSQSIETLNDATVREYLLFAAQESPKIAGLIAAAAKRIKDTEAAQTIDFDRKSKSAWYALNREYSRLRQSQQFERSGDACCSVEEAIEDIRDRCPAHASYGTKSSALQTLRKIGKTICLTEDIMGREVRKHFQCTTVLEKTMQQIVNSMSLADRQIMKREYQGDTTFVEKLKELQDLGSGYCLFERLDQVIELLEGPGNVVTESGSRQKQST